MVYMMLKMLKISSIFAILFINVICAEPHFEDNFVHSHAPDIHSASIFDFPRPQQYENGMPKCLPVSQLESGLYLDNVNPANTVTPPPWFNRTLANQGRKLVQEQFFSVLLAHAALDLLFYVTTPHLNRLVYNTGSFSKKTPENAARRLTSDVLQDKLWMEADIDSPALHMAFQKLRAIHKKATYRVRNVYPDIRCKEGHENLMPTNDIDTPMWRAFRQDVEPLKAKYPFPTNRIQSVRDGTSDELPFNMYDMAASSIFLTCGPMIYAKQFGIQGSTEEQLLGLMHLWAGLSYMLGIDDNYNINLHPDYNSAIEYCEEFAEHQFVRGLVNIDEDGMRAMDNIIESAMMLFPYINTKPGWLLFFFTIFELPSPNLKRITGLVGRAFNGALEPIVRPTLRTPWGRRIANYYMKARIRVASITYFGFDGFNQTQVAEKGWWLGRHNQEL